jgi:cytochrome c2
LVLQSANERHGGKLFARCQQCHRTRDIGEDLERILWM